jgi:hypothetical protein
MLLQNALPNIWSDYRQQNMHGSEKPYVYIVGRDTDKIKETEISLDGHEIKVVSKPAGDFIDKFKDNLFTNSKSLERVALHATCWLDFVSRKEEIALIVEAGEVPQPPLLQPFEEDVKILKGELLRVGYLSTFDTLKKAFHSTVYAVKKSAAQVLLESVEECTDNIICLERFLSCTAIGFDDGMEEDRTDSDTELIFPMMLQYVTEKLDRKRYGPVLRWELLAIPCYGDVNIAELSILIFAFFSGLLGIPWSVLKKLLFIAVSLDLIEGRVKRALRLISMGHIAHMCGELL